MKKLAVITGFGGINSAGRSSGHQAFKRLVFSALPVSEQLTTLNALAELMGLEQKTQIDAAWQQDILNGTLVRGFDNVAFDANAVPFHEPFNDADGTQCWRLTHKRLAVQSAGQLPQGFNPGAKYKSLHHPRGLQMAIYSMSDALGQLGLDWNQLKQSVRPDEISVYAGAAMAQLDTYGHGGMLQAALLGKRGSAKHCAMGFSEMPADFINAYVLGNVGSTGSVAGACASFLYNLRNAISDIKLGRTRIAIVGSSEAPIQPEVINGYHNMTALASEQNLRSLDALSDEQSPDFRRASRPFAENCGFTIAESAQYIILTDDDLALEHGLSIYAAVGDVFVNADGFKKSISNPGIGNYLTLAKAMASAQRWLGADALQHSYVHAHGSSTPSNRTTESEIFSRLATTFKLNNWPVTAVKSYLGHSIGSASGDQIITALGSWAYGLIPAIQNVEQVAADVHQENINFVLKHQSFNPQSMPLTFINAKGFGGNNASAFLLSPAYSQALLKDKHGAQAWLAYEHKNQAIQEQSQAWDEASSAGQTQPVYHFGEGVLAPEDVILSPNSIKLAGFEQEILL